MLVGGKLLAPVLRKVGDPPAGLSFETVSIPSESGSNLIGWLTEEKDAKGSVLLLHGIRSDRRSMVGRAEFLSAAGYNTLCIDFQGHGESHGDRITLGKLERLDTQAAVGYLNGRFPNLDVVIIGSSLGGAAALLAEYESPPAAFVVEAVFMDVETAIRNRLRMRLGTLGSFMTPLLSWQIKPRLDVSVNDLSPLRHVGNHDSPLLFIYGSEDQHAKPSEGRMLFNEAVSRKDFWEIEGAGHVDFHSFAQEEYERRILKFLDACLSPPSQ